jgi:hypothetical protein
MAPGPNEAGGPERRKEDAMTKRDVRRNMKEIGNLANSLLGLLGPAFTGTGKGHIETDIAGAATLAGLLLLRAAVPGLDGLEPGSAVISDVHEGQAALLAFMKGISFSMGLEPRKGWDGEIPGDSRPLFPTAELGRKLEIPFHACCAQSPLEPALYPYAAAMAAMKLVSAGHHMKLLDQRIGKAIACESLVAGSKTVPARPEALSMV